MSFLYWYLGVGLLSAAYIGWDNYRHKNGYPLDECLLAGILIILLWVVLWPYRVNRPKFRGEKVVWCGFWVFWSVLWMGQAMWNLPLDLIHWVWCVLLACWTLTLRDSWRKWRESRKVTEDLIAQHQELLCRSIADLPKP